MAEQCIICLTFTDAINYHHTIPRSRGGENSEQIPLCPTCHTALHANALAIKANIRSKKPFSKLFWRSSDEEYRARYYLEILVRALILPIPEGYTREHLLNVSVDTKLFEQFKLLQLDLGLTSQEKTLIYCIQQLLQIRGLTNTQQSVKPWFL